MKIVFSHWSLQEPFLELAALSNYSARLHGYETILYTDSKGYNSLKNIEYSEFRELPENILNKFPKNGWSLGKLLAASLIKEPFLHFDFDLILSRPLNQEIFNKKAIFSYQEIWMDYVLQKSIFIIKKIPDILNNNDYRSYNCSIFGGQDFESFNNVCKYIYEYAIEHAEYYDKISSHHDALKEKGIVKHYLFLTNIFEQLWMPKMLKNLNIDIDTILFNNNIQILENINYLENINPNDFWDKDYILKYQNNFSQYYKNINFLAKTYGIQHFFNQTKNTYRDKIINLCKTNKITY